MSAAPPHRDAIGRVWACGFAAGLLLVATGAADPCSPGLAQLPFLSPPQLAACVAAPGLAWFLLLDLVLIAAYTAFFLTATAWGARHLAGLGPFLGRFGRTLAVSPAVADLVENALLWFGGPALLVRVASTAKWLLLAVALGLALWALLVGTARFLLPWSQPPQFPPDVPDGEVGEPWPCVEGSGSAPRTVSSPASRTGSGYPVAGSGRRRSARACCRRWRARRGRRRRRSTSPRSRAAGTSASPRRGFGTRSPTHSIRIRTQTGHRRPRGSAATPGTSRTAGRDSAGCCSPRRRAG